MFLDHPPLTVALAMSAGVIAQGLARHIQVPGIVVLLAAGVGLGGDGLGVIRTEALGDALAAVVGFGVAVILFEGGLNLQVERLRRQATPIRRLVTIGALLGAVGAALVCRATMGWEWRLCALFGTLVMVTGPTVVSPLVRRIRLQPDIATILEAEGVFIDAIGATVAVVALEVAVAPSGGAVGGGVLGILARFAVGGAVGGAFGVVLAALLRLRAVVPRGVENILVLSVAVTAFETSNAFIPESGITAVIAAGMIVGNTRSRALGEIAVFKEQLTVLLIGTLFVLLGADVRVADVAALGGAGVATVAALMLVVRPAVVFACAAGTELTLREKVFLSWIAPRGIVAAAVASLFALELARAGIAGGTALRALVFLVIAVTVTVNGLTAAPVARWLGVRRARDDGHLFLGANPLARYLAERLGATGVRVQLIDASSEEARVATQAGLATLRGNGLDPDVLARARADTRRSCVGITLNESVNLLFARKVREAFDGPAAYVAIDATSTGVTADMVGDADARLLFGRAHPLRQWIAAWRDGCVITTRRVYRADEIGDPAPFASAPAGDLLPLLVERSGGLALLDDATRLRHGDVVEFAIDQRRGDAARDWLARAGWSAEA